MDATRKESSSSTGDVGIPQKRRKTDDVATGSSILNPPARNPQANKMNDSSKSLHSAANEARLVEIRTRINDLHCEEQKIFEDCEKNATEEIAKLKLHISELEETSQDAKAALKSAEAQFSQLKAEKDQRIEELLHKNADLEKRMIQQAEQDTEKLNAVKKRIIELRQDMKSEALYRGLLELKETELEVAKRKITELESEAKSLWEEVQDLLLRASSRKELKEEIQSVDNSGATPQETVEQGKPLCKMTSGDKDLLNIAENVVSGNFGESPSVLVKNQSKDLKEPICHQQKSEFNDLKESTVNPPKEEKLNSQEKCEDLKTKAKEVTRENVKPGPKSSKRGSSVPVIDKDPKKMSKLDRSSCPKPGSDDGHPQRIRIDNLYILASDGKFVDINSKTNYQRLSRTQYKCSKCGRVERSRVQVEDHIWCKHYDGRYRCPLCLDPSVTFSSRYHLIRHTRRIHSQEVKSRDFDGATEFLQVLTTAR